MTPKEKAIAALELREPEGLVPTLNVAFKGLPLERYFLILEVRKQHGRCS